MTRGRTSIADGEPRTRGSSPRCIAVLVLSAFAAIPLASWAQSGGQFEITRGVLANGGGTSGVDPLFRLTGTIALPGAVAGEASGGAFQVRGGFWSSGAGTRTAAPSAEPAPKAFRVYPSEPNPFNPQTTIRFDLPAASMVSVDIYDMRGARVRALVAGALPVGRQRFRWDGTDEHGAALASGVYLVRVRAGTQLSQQKITLLK